jgi:hypothetical protein
MPQGRLRCDHTVSALVFSPAQAFIGHSQNVVDSVTVAAGLRYPDAHRDPGQPLHAALQRNACHCDSQALCDDKCGFE